MTSAVYTVPHGQKETLYLGSNVLQLLSWNFKKKVIFEFGFDMEYRPGDLETQFTHGPAPHGP